MKSERVYIGSKDALYYTDDHGRTYGKETTFDSDIKGLYAPKDAVSELYVLTKDNFLHYSKGKKTIYGRILLSNDRIYSELVKSYSISEAWPNPFNPVTHFDVNLTESNTIGVEILNLLGQRVKVIKTRPYSVGKHTLEIDLQNMVSGVYVAKTTVGGQSIEIRQMTFLK